MSFRVRRYMNLTKSNSNGGSKWLPVSNIRVGSLCRSPSWRFIFNSLLLIHSLILIRYRIKWFITINSLLYSLDPLHPRLLFKTSHLPSKLCKFTYKKVSLFPINIILNNLITIQTLFLVKWLTHSHWSEDWKLARNIKHGGELMGLDMLLQDAKVIPF